MLEERPARPSRCPHPRSSRERRSGRPWMEIRAEVEISVTAAVAQLPAGYRRPGIDHLCLLSTRLWPWEGRAFVYVSLIAVVSLLGSFSASVVLSIVAVRLSDVLLAPPLLEFRFDASDDIVRIAVFLTTSLVVTALVTKLRASEARFRTFVDNATDAFFLLDEILPFSTSNRQAYAGLGYSREELIGKRPSDFYVVPTIHRSSA